MRALQSEYVWHTFQNIHKMRTLLRAITAGGGLFLGCAGLAAESEPPKNPPVEALTNAAQIRNLTFLQAQQARPVTLSGIVIDKNYVGTNWETIILQDPTAAVYAIGPRNTFSNCSAGDRLEVRGVTDPGGFAPIIQAQAAHKTGTASVPDPQPVTYQQLITGAVDGQWVEINGVVRVCFAPAPGADAWRIVVAMDGGLVPVR